MDIDKNENENGTTLSPHEGYNKTVDKTNSPSDELSTDLPLEERAVPSEDHGLSLDIDLGVEKPTVSDSQADTIEEIEEPFIQGLPEPDIAEDDSLAANPEYVTDIPPLTKQPKSKEIILMASAAIIILGLAGLGYYVMSPDDETTSTPITATVPTYQFADMDDDMPGFAPEENITKDAADIGFSAPPQPILENDMVADMDVPVYSEPVEKPADSAFSTPTAGIEETAVLAKDLYIETADEIDITANSEVLDINIPAGNIPTNIEEITPVQNLLVQDDLEFDDTPEISNIEQIPDNMELIPPSMPSLEMPPTMPLDTAVVAESVPQVSAIVPSVKTVIDMTPAHGQLKTSRTENIRDGLKEMPAQEALIRPIPKKYFIIKKSNNINRTQKIATKQAEKALRQGNAGAALGLLNKMAQDNPGNTSILMKQAIAHQQIGNIDSALRTYETILRQNPSNLNALTNMLGLLRKEKPQLALNKLHELRGIYPDNPGIAAQLAIIYGDLKDYESALKNLNIASGLDTPNAYYPFNKAVILDRMGHRGQATEMYKQAFRMHQQGYVGIQYVPIDAIRKRLHIPY